MPEIVTTSGATHSASPAVYANAAQPRDQDAAAVASWYASARGHGMVFQALAQGSNVQPHYLAEAIAAERRWPNTYQPDMDILERWLDRTTRHSSEQSLTPAPRQARAAQRLAKGRTGV